jgi:uncharacterized protein
MTYTERRTLANQYRILALLNKEESEDYAARAEALECGYEAHFDEGWFTADEDVLTIEQCEEVTSTLRMFEDLLVSFRHLKDKDGLNEQDLAFRGYDGNDETKYMAYARFFCETYDGGRRFQTLSSGTGFGFNSHQPNVNAYRAKLGQYRIIREAKRSAGGYDPLTAAEIKQVLAAGRWGGFQAAS